MPTPAPAARDRPLIVLVIAGPTAARPDWPQLWTVAQWQDARGEWHDVDGWRGALDEMAAGVGKKTWVIEDRDLGRGPFRWLVYDRPAGAVIAVSAAFYLPCAAGDLFEVCCAD